MVSAEAKTIRPTNLVSGFLVTRNRTGDKGSFREIAGSWQGGALRQAQGKRAEGRKQQERCFLVIHFGALSADCLLDFTVRPMTR
jgi:hypothetical protein